MRLLIVGDSRRAGELTSAVKASGVAVEHRPDGPRPTDGPNEIAAIAGALREFERSLSGGGTEAVLVASGSPAALAAVLVATKLGVRVARLDPLEEGGESPSNARLIGQLADATLAPDAAAIVDWVRGGYPDPS